MKKILCFLSKFFRITFALFTCTSFGLLALNRAFDVKEAPDWDGIIKLFLQILLFSAVSAISTTALDIPKRMNGAVRELLKFILCFGAFILSFVVLVSDKNGGINVIILSTVFTVLYAVCTFAASGIKAFMNGKDALGGKSEEEYKSVFDAKKQ